MITWKEAIQKTAKGNREFLTIAQFLNDCLSLYNKENGTEIEWEDSENDTVPELLTFLNDGLVFNIDDLDAWTEYYIEFFEKYFNRTFFTPNLFIFRLYFKNKVRQSESYIHITADYMNKIAEAENTLLSTGKTTGGSTSNTARTDTGSTNVKGSGSSSTDVTSNDTVNNTGTQTTATTGSDSTETDITDALTTGGVDKTTVETTGSRTEGGSDTVTHTGTDTTTKTGTEKDENSVHNLNNIVTTTNDNTTEVKSDYPQAQVNASASEAANQQFDWTYASEGTKTRDDKLETSKNEGDTTGSDTKTYNTQDAHSVNLTDETSYGKTEGTTGSSDTSVKYGKTESRKNDGTSTTTYGKTDTRTDLLTQETTGTQGTKGTSSNESTTSTTGEGHTTSTGSTTGSSETTSQVETNLDTFLKRYRHFEEHPLSNITKAVMELDNLFVSEYNDIEDYVDIPLGYEKKIYTEMRQ